MRQDVSTATQDSAATGRGEFAFVSDPANQEPLTPPWLRFEVLMPKPLPQGEGTR